MGRIGLNGGDCWCLQYAVASQIPIGTSGFSCYNRFETDTSVDTSLDCQFEEIKGEEKEEIEYDGEETAQQRSNVHNEDGVGN